ncbi:MAG: restriction endonuclease subunit S, partial [Cryomorphaceae bacterium]|nr:restriction endonuclease subunit S [Cryomorphaceae bacterium]
MTTSTKITFQKYAAYKDLRVEWLGEIPEGWRAIRMKFLFRDVSEKNKPDAELLSVTQDQGVVPRTWVENRMVMPSGNLESFKFIQKGDFAISLRSFEGGLEYCHHDGIISPAYTVLKKKNGLVDGYYKYLFKSKSFISEIQTSVVGIREGKNISYFELSYSLLPIPTKEEQTAIATFLDDKTAKIDRAIAQKEKMIGLLKERKQIVIQTAVTKGLNYDWNDKHEDYDSTTKNHSQSNIHKNHSPRRMKDSGVEWIGEIPEEWEVKRLKYVLRLRNEKVLSLDSSLPYVGMENIESKTGKYLQTNTEVEGLANKLNAGDILFGKLRPYLAKVYLAEFDGICSTEFVVYQNPNGSYFSKLLLSDVFVQVVDGSTYGAKMPRASSE